MRKRPEGLRIMGKRYAWEYGSILKVRSYIDQALYVPKTIIAEFRKIRLEHM